VTRIIIQITGNEASGKTVTLKAIAEFLKIQFGCSVKQFDQRYGDVDILNVDIPDNGHKAIVDWTKGIKPKLNKGTLR
jgi:uridine kinase